jgi:hypothetical protein
VVPVAAHQRRDARARHEQSLRGRAAEPRDGGVLRPASHLDDPRPLVERRGRGRGEVQRELLAGGADCVERRGQRARRVEHEQITRAEEVRQLGEMSVDEPPVVAVGDQQPDVVATGAALLRRLVRLERRQLGSLRDRRAHASSEAR